MKGPSHIEDRIDRAVNVLVERRFREAVAAWAAENDGKLPTRFHLHEELRAEFELLAEALGPWAVVPGKDIFPQRFDCDLFDTE